MDNLYIFSGQTLSAALRIQGEKLDLDAILNSVDIRGASIRRAPHKGPFPNLSVWEFRTPFIDTLDIMLPLGQLMSSVSCESGKKLSDLASAQGAEFTVSCTIYRNTLISETTPILFFNQSALGWMSSIRTDLDIDIIEMAGEYEAPR